MEELAPTFSAQGWDPDFSEAIVAVPTAQWTLLSAAGRSCEEGNHTLEVPYRLAEKLPAGETHWKDAHGCAGHTVWKRVLMETHHTNGRGPVCLPTCWHGSRPLAAELLRVRDTAAESSEAPDRVLCQLAKERGITGQRRVDLEQRGNKLLTGSVYLKNVGKITYVPVQAIRSEYKLSEVS